MTQLSIPVDGDGVRDFEFVVEVPLETQGGEPLGSLAASVVIGVEEQLIDTAEPGDTLPVTGSFTYGRKVYRVELPVELAWLREEGVQRVVLRHPAVRVEPIEVSESTASRPEGGPHLTVTNRKYRTTSGGTVNER